MKTIRIVIFMLLAQIVITAQTRNFTIEDVVINSYTSLSSQKLSQLDWIPNTDFVYYAENNNFVKLDAKSAEKKDLFSLDDLNLLIGNGKELRRLPKLKWIDEDNFTYWNDNNFIRANYSSNKIKQLINIPKVSENRTVSPDNNLVAYTIENNLFFSAEKDRWKQVTNETEKGIVHGQTVSRNEFGIRGGIFWSPKSNFIAFYQKDETGVTDYPILEIGSAPATVKYIKYPMTGQTSEIIRVGVYDIENDKTIWLNTEGEKDQYLTNVTWDPSEKYIYVAHLNRDQNHMRLIKYDTVTGEKVKLLFEEKDEQYVEPEHKLQFICSDDDKFVWFSERDGFQHLYLYNTDGKLIKQITAGEWVVKSIVGINKEIPEIYFVGTKDTPTEDHLYSVKIKTGEISRITKPGANHKLTYNEYNGLFIDIYSSIDTPTVSQIINSKGEIVTPLLKSSDPISEYKISKPNLFVLKGENNIDLHSRIILPVDFDSTKKYPVIVYVYGGPHDQMVTNEWYSGRYDFWFQYMAQKGFIIFTLDNRGSGNRGLEFEQAVFGRLGTKEIEDQLVGLNYLKSLKYVDSNRVGVYGWSYGGFMTASLMLRTNDAFKVGVGGGTVIDWKFYEIMYGERYMDTPQSNPEGYAESSLLNYVDNLNGKLLLVHGTSDPTVVIEQTLEFVKKATNLNKKLDFYPYVGHVHGVRGKDSINLYEKISNYFIDNL